MTKSTIEDLLSENKRLSAENEKLRAQLAATQKIAFLDSLTDLPNRHGYDRYVAALQALCGTPEFQIALAGGKLGGLLVVQVDIDHFKSVNSMLTHFGGDAVLREFGARLARGTRMNAQASAGANSVRCLASLMVQEYLVRSGLTGSDLVSRWGGEEFFCLFPLCYHDGTAASTAYDDADRIVQRLMNAIRREPIMVSVNDITYESIKNHVIGNPQIYYQNAKLIEHQGKKMAALPISASMGYAVVGWEEFIANSSQDTAHLFRNVVDLMRRAKETGRNRAVTVRAAAHNNQATIQVYEGRALHKTDLADMVHIQASNINGEIMLF